MKQILINPEEHTKNPLSLKNLIILNLLKAEKKCSQPQLESVLAEYGIPYQTSHLERNDFIQISNTGVYTLTKKGKDYFNDRRIAYSEEEYQFTCMILTLWNDSPHTTKHSYREYGSKQTKLFDKLILILRGVLSDTPCEIMEPALIDKESTPIPAQTPTKKDIVDTVKEYLLKFEPEYYPRNKQFLPNRILYFFISYHTSHSEFWSVFFDGVEEIKKTSLDTIIGYGVPAATITKAFTVLLNSSDVVLESKKLEVFNAVIRFHRQWEEWIKKLDAYFIWNEVYRVTIKDFDTILNMYLNWMERMITGERFPAYLQITDNHKISEQFKTYIADKMGVKFSFSDQYRDYLLKNVEKYNKLKKGEIENESKTE